jgi:hypothetical protein
MASRVPVMSEALTENEIRDLLNESFSEIDDDSSSETSEFSENIELGSESEEETSNVDVTSTNSSADNGWQSASSNFNSITPHPFNVRNSGYKPPFGNRPGTVMQFFQLFFTNELINRIVQDTNNNAKLKIMKSTPLAKKSIWHGWLDVTSTEMKAVFGMILNMGLNPKSDIKLYFSEQWLHKQQFFKDVFQRTRFLQIFWALHVSGHDSQPAGFVQSRANKVQFVLNYICAKFKEYYVPFEQLAVDESTIGFKGRIVFKMYNPQKPTKWGVRVYVLADSKNGYIYDFEPYYGSTTTNSLTRPDLPFTARIVLHLCQSLVTIEPDSGFHIFTDRFYSSYQLAVELLKINMNFTGTVMVNRKGLPVQLKNMCKKLKKDSVVAFEKDSKFLVLAWRDKRVVTMISTFHNADLVEMSRRKKGGVIELMKKPKVIIDYNKYMGSVDRSDQYCGSYAFIRKTYRWWRKVFFWSIEVSVVNSFILYNLMRAEENLPPVTHKTFRESLIEELVKDVITNSNGSRKRGRPSTTDREERLNGKFHSIAKLPGRKSKDCIVCSDRSVKGGRRETVYYCETCERKPGLHPDVCFTKYHTQEKFKN